MAQEPHREGPGERQGLPGRVEPESGRKVGSDEGYGPVLMLLGRLAGIGWTLAIAILAGAFGGWWLDGRLGTAPWLTLAGLTLGAVVAFTIMFTLLRALFKNQNGDNARG